MFIPRLQGLSSARKVLPGSAAQAEPGCASLTVSICSGFSISPMSKTESGLTRRFLNGYFLMKNSFHSLFFFSSP